MNINIERALSYTFEDQEWIGKLVVLGLVGMVPILGMFYIAGFLARTLRGVATDAPRPLPANDQFADTLSAGVPLGVAQLVYGLPVIACAISMIISAAGTIMAANGDSDRVAAMFVGTSFLVFGTGVCALLLYALALGLIIPAITILTAVDGSIGTAFNFGRIIGYIRDNMSAYITTWIMVLVFGIVIGFIPSIFSVIPLIGACLLFLTIPILLALTTVTSAHLYGQLARATGAFASGSAAPTPQGGYQ